MKLFFVSIFFVCVTSCHSSKHIVVEKPPENKVASINGEWELQMLFASDNKWNEAPVIKLDFSAKTFIANTPCNTVTGNFTVSENYFSFNKPAITKKGCGGYNDNKFVAALSKINHYTFLKDLLEFGQGEILLMKLKRK